MYQAILADLEAEAAAGPPGPTALSALGAAARKVRPTLVGPSGFLPLDAGAPAPWPPTLSLQGLLGSQIFCGACGYQSAVRLTTFESISLALPGGLGASPAVALEDLLHQHFQPERITGYHCARCSLERTRAALLRRVPTATALRALAPAGDGEAATAARRWRPPAADPWNPALGRTAVALQAAQRLLDSDDFDDVLDAPPPELMVGSLKSNPGRVHFRL